MTSELSDNPFFNEWQTPFGYPDFTKIKTEHFIPAFKTGMQEQINIINKIAQSPEEPTFKNTIEAWETSDELLSRVSHVFFNLTSAHTNEDLQTIDREITPLLSIHNDKINLNEKLFNRVQKLWQDKPIKELSREQTKLLEKYYKNMVRGGANLNAAEKEKLSVINERMALLEVQFSENVLKDDNSFEMVLGENDLKGLPDNVKNSAKEAAHEKGYTAKWLFTLHQPSFIPFLQFADRRDLREKIYKAYISRGNNGNSQDNLKIIAEIINLRIRKAQLLGYKTHAHYVLEETMAKTPVNVYNLLDKIWPLALTVAKKECKMLQKVVEQSKKDFTIQPWDWWYYAEKIYNKKYNLNENEIRPYLQLDNVIKGAFALAEKLFDISFEEKTDFPKYHRDVKTYLVKESNGEILGIYLSDWFYRFSKRGGAWMNEYRPQSYLSGKRVIPIVCNVGNFIKPIDNIPSLLSLDEVETLFHEFGHALHGLLSNTSYATLSGTNVSRDFVEFPSQLLENWVLQPEMLKQYAFHYKTGEAMPEQLVTKINKSRKFNMGFKTVEYMAAAYLDLAWHTLSVEKEHDINAYEKEIMDKIGLIPQITSRYRTTNFRHIVGGYDAAYYSYLWSEMLTADTFELFKKNGIFDKETAANYRKKVLACGGTMDEMEMYIDFRGREPDIKPYLKQKGLMKSD